jgi:ApbE superfamily uncharacterized protein (UPF0280 family)
MFKTSFDLQETKLNIISDIDPVFLKEFITSKRNELKRYISTDYNFFNSHIPIDVESESQIIKTMVEAAKIANVGPMAAVAGTISELTLKELLKKGSKFSIVDNGGDIAFINQNKDMTCGIYSGNSSLSAELGFKFKPQKSPMGLCTSSGTVGYSFSYGRADSVSVIASKASIADTIATAIGNNVLGKKDSEAVENGLNTALTFEEHFIGMLIILGDSIATIGKLPKLITLKKEGISNFKEDTII